jgi:hypothetical protein
MHKTYGGAEALMSRWTDRNPAFKGDHAVRLDIKCFVPREEFSGTRASSDIGVSTPTLTRRVIPSTRGLSRSIAL